MHTLLPSVPLTLQQATTNLCLCWRLLDTHRQVWVSLSWAHCSFLLGPGLHKVLSVPSKSLFPQPCVSSEGSMVWLMPTSSKRLMAYPGLLHPEPLPLWQATAGPHHCRRHSNTWRRGWLSLWCVQGSVWALWTSLVSMGYHSKHDFAPSYHLAVASPFPCMWGTFFWWDPTFSRWWLFSNKL